MVVRCWCDAILKTTVDAVTFVVSPVHSINEISPVRISICIPYSRNDDDDDDDDDETTITRTKEQSTELTMQKALS